MAIVADVVPIGIAYTHLRGISLAHIADNPHVYGLHSSLNRVGNKVISGIVSGQLRGAFVNAVVVLSERLQSGNFQFVFTGGRAIGYRIGLLVVRGPPFNGTDALVRASPPNHHGGFSSRLKVRSAGDQWVLSGINERDRKSTRLTS